MPSAWSLPPALTRSDNLLQLAVIGTTTCAWPVICLFARSIADPFAELREATNPWPAVLLAGAAARNSADSPQTSFRTPFRTPTPTLPNPMPSTDFVIVPTYNEVDNLEDLLTALLDLPLDLGVIVVDDNSPDGTGELAERWHDKEPDRVQVIHRPAKLGLGTAYLAGFHRAMKEFDAARVFTMDADFSHHPRYIPGMVDLGKSKDIVIGSRYVPGGGSRNCSRGRILLSRVANIVARLPLGLEARDATAGYRLYHRRVLDSIPLHEIKSSGYSFQVEMLFLCQRRGWHTGEVPILFEDRRHGTTKISRHEVYAAVYTVARLFWRRLFGKEPQRRPASR